MRVVFFGSPAFAVPTLAAVLETPGVAVAAVVTQPDRPRGRGQKVAAGPVKAFAEARGLRVLQPSRLADPGVRESLAALAPISAWWRPTARSCRRGCWRSHRRGLINVHASLLPAWRGAAPVHRAILAGDRESGVTIMRVVQELDAGPMLDRVRVPIDAETTSDMLERVLAVEGATLLKDVLERLRAGPVPEEPQDGSRATYAPKITRADAPMDFRRPAPALHDQVRGLHPWPHASFSCGGRRVIAHRSVVPNVPSEAAPGTVVRAGADGIDIAAGDGQVLRLVTLQLEGGRPLTATAFQAGRGLAVGDACGPS